jgi:hypothetical protein
MKSFACVLVVLGAVVISCDQRRTGPPPKKNVDVDMDNSVVPKQDSTAPELANFDGRNFITEKDAEAMGANMDPRVKEKVNYSNSNGVHQWKLGLDELQMSLWAYTNAQGAAQRLEKEKREDTNSCNLLLKMNKASLAEVKDSGMGNGHMRRFIRTDGNGGVSFTVQKGNYVVKVGWADSCPGVSTLDDFDARARKALKYVLDKLR